MDRKIYLQRHGESESNVKKIFTCRKLDPDLTENGKKQIEDKIDFYKDKNIAKIVSSPSKRAMQTAEILSNALGLKFSIDENLLEVDVGDLEGQSELDDDRMNLFLSINDRWINKNENVSFPHGESLFDINRRIEHVLKTYFNDITGNIILTGHCDFFALLLNTFFKLSDIKPLFLKRGGNAEYSQSKNKWKILN